jgi:hypothetical protein
VLKPKSATTSAVFRRETARLVKTLSTAPRYARSATPIRAMAEHAASVSGHRPACPKCGAGGLLRTEISGLARFSKAINVFYVCEDCSYVSRISVMPA